jgi:2-iminobutanoate/2-iminopropanoate deaminase
MEKKVVMSKDAPAPIGPYSQAIFINSTLYISGQIAIDAKTGNFINDDIVEETHQVMRNIESILKEAGLTLGNVVKSTIFLKDMNNFTAVNKIYGEYFRIEPPARETVEVSRLPKDANVEISCIAVK